MKYIILVILSLFSISCGNKVYVKKDLRNGDISPKHIACYICENNEYPKTVKELSLYSPEIEYCKAIKPKNGFERQTEGYGKFYIQAKEEDYSYVSEGERLVRQKSKVILFYITKKLIHPDELRLHNKDVFGSIALDGEVSACDMIAELQSEATGFFSFTQLPLK